MIRHIRSAAIGLALLAGSAAVASAQANQPARPDAPRRAEQHMARGRIGRKLGHALFHGIKLTDAEKARVRAVHAKYKPEMKQLRESAKPQMKALREARQKGDTASARALWAKSAGTRAQGAAMVERMRVDLRAALTPEHQAQFDQNVVKVKARVAARAARVRKHVGRGDRSKIGA